MNNGYGNGADLAQNTVTGSLGAGLLAPKSSPPMDVSMRSLGQQIERLQQAVQLLQGKLDPVLYSEPPTTTATQAVDASARRASSNLGCAINSYADQVEDITERVNGMVRRCEL